ncbi:MAG: vWA domain-containing protein [Promethearchaeia archaeon]
MTLMEIFLQYGNEGMAIFNPDDLNDIGIKENDLIKIYEESSLDFVVLKAISNNKVQKDTLIADPNILSNLGIEDGFLVEVEPFSGIIKKAKKLTIEFSTIDSDPMEFFQKSSIEHLKDFLSNYYFSITSEIYWPEKNATLRVNIDNPIIGENELCIYSKDCEIKLMEQVQSMPFNAILLIDKSGSMNRRDVILNGIENVLEDLKNRLIDVNQNFNTSSFFPELRELFNRLSNKNSLKESYVKDSEGNWTVKKSKGASRLDSVIFATLLFFQLKISRGFGEKCAFVIYADEAKPINFGEKFYIEASEFTPQICNNLIKKIRDTSYLRYGNTNISSAIEICKKIALDFRENLGSKNPLMILLLTDGSPYPKELDNPKKLLKTISSLKETLDKYQIPFVIYAIGIGEVLNKSEDLLTHVAKEGNGEFHYVSRVDKLIHWYQTLANNFAYKISEDIHSGDNYA